MLPSAPCKDCTERYLGCHNRCPKYASFKERNEVIKGKWREYYQPYLGCRSEKVLRKIKGER